MDSPDAPDRQLITDSHAAQQSAPDPDDPRKPEGPTDLTSRSWGYVARKTVREFSSDQCTDLAAGLTYYAVLALFPALLALVSLLGVFGQGPSTVNSLLDIVKDVAPSAADQIKGPLQQISSSKAAGLGLIVGLLGALWSASGYVGAFGRAMNRIYGVAEGRPIWKLRPVQLVVTLLAVVLVAISAVILVISGPVASSVGDTIGVGSTVVTVWNIAKWPVLILVVVTIVAIFYWATPNVQQPKFRWISGGAAIAILVWILASVAFGFYVGNFSSYDKTYGSLAGVIVFLLWLWITNVALLFGAEFDAEVERGRQLQAGIAAEADIQLPPRDTRNSDKAAKKRKKDIDRGRALRESSTIDLDESEKSDRN